MPAPRPLDVAEAARVARLAARAGGAAALRHWRGDFVVETKSDGSRVTIADREAEEAILEVLREHFPEHAVLAEESGARGDDGAPRWIVDPVDGTHGFTRGGESWGPLVALEVEGVIVAGALALPARDRVYHAARGQGCWRDGRRLLLAPPPPRREAVLVLGCLERLLVPPLEEGVRALVREAQLIRSPGDVGGVAMVLEAQGDAWLEAGVELWDLAAPSLLLEEAGARCTDFAGAASLADGRCLAAAPALHEALLAAFV